jgi:flagellar M-ring protein FliF
MQRVLIPPSPEKVKVLRDLVAGITGFNPERGDQIVVESLPFETTLLLEPPAATSPPAAGPGTSGRITLPTLKLDKRLLGICAGAAVVLVLLVIVAGRLLRRRRSRVELPASPAELPAGATTAVATSSPAAPAPAVAGEEIDAQLAERDALEKRLEIQALKSLKLTPVITKTAEVLAKHLREKISKDPEVSAQVLRAWIREEEL